MEIELALYLKSVRFDLHKLDRRLNCELASLLEERQDIPPVDFESIKSDV